jgi:hypothetical protein
MEMIKIKIENQFGAVTFETNQEKIDEFNEYYGDEFDELCKEDDFITDVRTLGTDVYLDFESDGKFILIQEWTLSDSSNDISVQGFSLIFENCTCPTEFEKSLQILDGGLIYIKNKHEIWFGYDIYRAENDEYKLDNGKFQEIVEDGPNGSGEADYYLEREGVIRYENWKSILDFC